MATVRAVLLAVVLGLASAGNGWGQACAGVPLLEREWAATAAVGHFDYDVGPNADGFEVGAGARADLAGPLALGGEYVFRAPGDASPRIHVLSGALLYRLPARLPLPVGLCAMSGAGLAVVEQSGTDTNYTNVTLPLGIGLAVPLRAGGRLLLLPFMIPQALFSRLEGRVLGVTVVESDVGPGIEVGMGMRHGRLVGSVSLFASDLDPSVGTPPYAERRIALRGGIIF